MKEGHMHVSIEMENDNIASQDIERKDSTALIKLELQHDPLVTSIKEMLESLHPLSSECCIYRVPEKLRRLNVEAYTPRVVSIGPLHHGEKHLQAMAEQKWRYLQTFLTRTGRSLEDHIKVIRTWEERARHCYAETIVLSSDEFVKMLLVDGSFVVELLLRSHFPQLVHEGDRIFRKPWLDYDVWEDMMLLENQLPFFVLEGLFTQEGNPSFLELTFQYFIEILKINGLPRTIFSSEIKHFVDFIRCCYLSSFPRQRHKGNARFERPPSVTRIHGAGIKIKIGSRSSLLDVKFNNGVLEIPSLKTADRTETLFRNLIAFEQCHCMDRYIIDYFALLSGMINTSKDADLLVEHGVIKNMLGSSEDVSALFNTIFKEVLIGSSFYFSSLCENLNAYCRSPWHNWKATLKRDYFSTPWAVISVIAAVLLLVLTFIQSVCSIISL